MTSSIVYTSKRRHKPDVVGAELAPSMTYTNWTAGNSATLSNDASGNLKVARNGTNNPYAYKSISVTNGSIYRVSLAPSDDGTSQKWIAQIGSSATNQDLANYDLRGADNNGGIKTYTTYVRANSTSLVITLYCLTSTGTEYSLWAADSVSVKAVTTQSHDEINVLHSDGVFNTSYTASSSTIGLADIFGGTDRDDNAFSVTNTGAAYGQAQRTYPFPSVSGRTYNASAIWIPHECAQATINIGTTLGGSETATATFDADIDGATPFFTTGTDDAGSALRWNFTSTLDSWTSTGTSSFTSGATYATAVTNTTSGRIASASLSFSGYENRYVAVRLRRSSATWTQNPVVFFTTSGHGISGSYYSTYSAATFVNGTWVVVLFDMWQLAAGGTDWKDNTITGIAIRPDTSGAATFDVDWVSVGNANPLEVTFDATQAYHYLSLKNSNESGAISYYVLPNVTQQNSEYTLSPAISAADQEYLEDTRQAISLNGTTETTYYREDENWTATTTIIDGNDALADYLEFLSSCKGGETFTIDLYGDGDTKTAMLRPGASSIQRVEQDKFRVTIAYRVLA